MGVCFRRKGEIKGAEVLPSAICKKLIQSKVQSDFMFYNRGVFCNAV